MDIIQSRKFLSLCGCVIALSISTCFGTLAQENLDDAEAFLKENSSVEGMISLEEGKLQYRVEQVGEGAIVEGYFSPIIHCSGRLLDGKVFVSYQEDQIFPLKETIPGFEKGITGMKEGEKRTLFIHPELGHGLRDFGCGIPPNSLLIFEIEVVKADAGESNRWWWW